MAFCTKCGNRVDDNVKFCSKCGAPMGAAVPMAAAPAATGAAPAQGSGALKIILIVVGAIVLLGVIGVGTVGYIGYRAAKAIKVNATPDSSEVTLPGMKISGGEGASAEKVAADLGIDVYPGAVARRGSAGAVQIGKLTVGGAEFETDDPPDKVAEFYRSRYPNSNIHTADANNENIIVSKENNWISINIERHGGGKTRIRLSRMSGAPSGTGQTQ